MEQSQQHAGSATPAPSAPPAQVPPPPPPPRQLTGAVRARTWTEPRVRSWWVLASALLALTLYVVGRQTVDWLRERRLIADGVPTAALVEQAGTMTTAARQQPDSICVLSFERPDGTRHRVSGVLPEHMERGIAIPVTQTVMIRVDPVDPDRWTDRTAPPPLTRQAVALAVALPLVGGLALVGAVQRRRAAGAWGDGPASAALVLDARQTPVAPRSRAVRCAPADSADNRVFTVFLPPGSAAVARGDVLWVVRPPGRPQPAYAVEWFARESGRVGSASGTALTTPA